MNANKPLGITLLLGLIGSVAAGAAELAPAPDTLAEYREIRRAVRSGLRGARDRCDRAFRPAEPRAAGRLELRLRLSGEGRLEVETWTDLGFVNAPGLPAAASECLRDEIGRMRLAPPPAGRPVQLCVPLVFKPDGFIGSYRKKPGGACAGSLRVGPVDADPQLLYRERVAEVVWAGEEELRACFPRGEAQALALRWQIAGNGRVATVTPPGGQGAPIRACVRRTILRWKFPPPPGNKAFYVLHTFEPADLDAL